MIILCYYASGRYIVNEVIDVPFSKLFSEEF